MGKVVKAVAGIALVAFAAPIAGAIGISAITAGTVSAIGAALVLGTISQVLFAPKVPKSQLSRLNVTLDPSTPRKAVFGTTAMNLDLRYHETSGTDQEYVDYIIAVAAHKVASIDQIWFDETKAWDSGTVQSTYSGYLTINVREEGTDANYININGGTKWGSSRRLTGCAYVHIRIKRTGNSKKTESPLVSGLPSRVTIIGEGAPLYDPRLDSTVPGGSGAHRSDDQDTWGAYTDADDCDNPALQLLWWLLGWKINDKLSIGCGVPAARIDMESFITAANLCDESVTLATGGTQYRYRTSGTASDSDDRMDIINNLLASMNGTLRDNDGKLTLTVLKNDLADWTLQFDDNDVLDEFKWDQTRGLSSSYNKVRGRYVDPSNNSLYQLVEYPEIGFDSPDGIERSMTLDLGYVEDGRRAQRIAKQVLQRNQYRGMFSATFTAKAMGCSVGDIILLSFSPLGWSNKPFRVVSQEIGFDGRVPLALVEENTAIYAWDAEDSAPVTPTAPTIYDPLNNPFILGVTEAYDTALQAISDAADAQDAADGKIVSFYQTSMPTGSLGDFWIDTDDGNKLYRHNGTTFVEVQDDGIATAISDAAGAQATADGKVTTFYQTGAPTAEGVGDLWYDTDDDILYRWDGSDWSTQVGSLGAPSGTDVGGRSSDTIADTIGSDGSITDDKVDTDAIVDNAVSDGANANTAGSVTIPVGSPFWVSLQSVTFTASADPVTIQVFSILDIDTTGWENGDSVEVTFRLKRGTTVIWTAPADVSVYYPSGSMGVPVSFAYVDTPSAGSVTYTLEASAQNGNNTVPAYNRVMVALQNRK